MSLFLKPDIWNTDKAVAYWLKDLALYGQNPYVDAVLSRIEQRTPAKVFDVGIGSGFPFASRLMEKQITVHGCDVSLPLLKECQKHYPSIQVYHTGSEMLSQIVRETYDVVYCLRSSWYFPDICQSIDNMCAITRPGGTVIFDIMNADSPRIRRSLRAEVFDRWRKIVKNMTKKILNTVFRTSYVYDPMTFFAPGHPVSFRDIDAYFDRKQMSYARLTFEQVVGEELPFNPQSFRILYMVTI